MYCKPDLNTDLQQGVPVVTGFVASKIILWVEIIMIVKLIEFRFVQCILLILELYLYQTTLCTCPLCDVEGLQAQRQ